MIYTFFNPLANNGNSKNIQEKIKEIINRRDISFINITEIESAKQICKDLKEDDEIIIAGGDGTLNRFVNDIYELHLTQKIFLYPCGSGNDFLNDIKNYVPVENNLIPLNEFIESLPIVYVNDIKSYFVNGIGFGIDGYCCEEGDKIRAKKKDKPVNYTKIAIKGIFGGYKPVNAKVVVDGKEYFYKKVWLAPAMIGRFYGGGMMIAPNQDRLNKEKTLSCVVLHCPSALKVLMNFPKIFTGKHITLKIIDIKVGHKITVEYNKPVALQIDGETVSNVLKYTALYGEK